GFSQELSIVHEQRHGNQCHQFDRGGNIAVAPGEVAAPVGVPRVKADIGEQQEKTGRPIRAYLWSQTLPQPCQEENCQHKKRIEEKNRLLRLEERSEKAGVKGRAPGKVRRQRRIHLALFPGAYGYIGTEKGSVAVKLVGTIKQEKEQVNGCGDFAVG